MLRLVKRVLLSTLLQLKLFTYLYFIVALLLYIVALPFLLLASLKRKYRVSIPSRFFLYHNLSSKESDIYFHACSVGEVRALSPLLDRLKDREITISTITQTGFRAAKSYEADVRYLPFEIFMPFWFKKHSSVVVLEAEFWYLFFLSAKLKGAKLILLNTRISKRSYLKYYKMRWLFKHLFALPDKIFCQSLDDKKRLETLGASNIEVVGNIKLAQNIKATTSYLKPDAELIVAASTHDGEERAILEAFLQICTPQMRLLIVPRHPERFESVWQMITASKVECARFSSDRSFKKSVTLVDSMGELNSIYAISDLVILGGAFRDDVGGHNVLEPAHFGCKIITGKHLFNQQELVKHVKHIKIIDESLLVETLKHRCDIEPSYIDGECDLSTIIEQIRVDNEK